MYIDSEQFMWPNIYSTLFAVPLNNSRRGNIVDHVSVLAIAAYLLSQPYYMC